MTPEEIQREFQTIKNRNTRVETDKAWETSWTRRLFIVVSTYIIAAVWLVIIYEPNAWLKALVPAVGYILSTLSIPVVKKWWVNSKM